MSKPFYAIFLAILSLVLTLSSSIFAAEKTGLSNFLGNYQKPKLLKPEEAFRLDLSVQNKQLVAHWKIAEGYYLYRDRIEVFSDNKMTQKLTIQPQQGKLKEDPLFGSVYVFYQQTSLQLPRNQLQGLNRLTFKYQGCADLGVCYAPQITSIDLKNLLPLLGISEAAAATTPINPASADIVSATDQLQQQLKRGNLFITLGLFFIAGLLLSFTPCVFPMIPILSGIIAKQGLDGSSKKAFSISMVYVLAMASTYTLAGIIAGLMGKNLQAALQNPVVISTFAALFVALALSMFGFYNLELPQSLQSRLNKLSNKQQAGSYVGVAIMGLLSALVVGPCVAPPLAGALLYIGQTGDAFLGGSALFMLSMGMGLPLIVFATVAGQWLPKAGKWMQTVKSVFGVALLAMAIWILDRIVPVWLSMLLWSNLLIISAIYLGAFEPLDSSKPRSWNALFKGMGWVSLLLGIVLILGLATGGRSLLQPLTHLNNPNLANNQSDAHYFRNTPAGNALQQALTSAKNQNTPSMIYITAEWCVSCKELDLLTFRNPSVIKAMGDAIIFKVDVTENTPVQQQLQKKLSIIGPPTILFYDSKGQEIRNFRIVGLVGADEFSQRIRRWKSS